MDMMQYQCGTKLIQAFSIWKFLLGVQLYFRRFSVDGGGRVGLAQ